MNLSFKPKEYTGTYVYYSPGLVVPAFTEIENERGLTSIDNIISGLIDLSRLPEDNSYYKKYAPVYKDTYTGYFGDINYNCNENEYYNFFNHINSRLRPEDSCRNINHVKDDLSFLKLHKRDDVNKLVDEGTELLLSDNRYCVYAIKSYDSMRILMSKSYSCFASDDTNCFKGYCDLGAVCYVIVDNSPTHKTHACLMNVICESIGIDCWIDNNGTQILNDLCVEAGPDGRPTDKIIEHLTFKSIANTLKSCKGVINQHYNKNQEFSKSVISEKLFFNSDVIRERYNDNIFNIKHSYNPKLQESIYNKILSKFNELQSDQIFGEIKEEYKNFNKAYFAKVPPSEVQIHGLWRFWLIDEHVDNIDINGNIYKSTDFFPKTYAHVHRIDKSTDHQGVLSFGLSILKPNCYLNAHTGYFNNMPHNCVFRLHLPIDVPTTEHTQCGLNLYESIDEPGWGPPTTEPTRNVIWKEQEMLVFDDSFKHDAWNYSDESRAVLIIDYLDDNKLVSRLTGRNPLTGEVSNVDTLAREWHNFFIDDLMSRNYVSNHVKEIERTPN